MILQTHIAIAHATFLTASIFTQHQPTLLDAILTTFFAVFPADLDSRESVIGKLFRPLSEYIEHNFSHRTITHSLLAQIVTGIVLYFTASTGVFLSIMCAWVSHSWSDMATTNGVEYFYPARIHCVIPANHKFRFKIMGVGELIVCVVASLSTIPLHNAAMKAEGARALVRESIGMVEWTRESYDLQKGNYKFFVELQGTDNIKLTPINGIYQVVASLGSDGFIILNEGQKITACKSNSCQWYAARAVLRQGEPETTTTHHVVLPILKSDDLINALLPIKPLAQIFIIGKAKILGTTKIKEPVPKNIDFEYESFDAIQHGLIFADVDIFIQIRHDPETTLPKFKLDESKTEINPLLNQWLKY